ncbi:MAG: DNA polymerase IV, partial [Chloroflexi bacterium]|nr:DNA polymerase IV [Chloroflexota bacterium]
PAGRAFLAPLPVGMLWGVGPKTQAYFHREGILTIGALAGLSDARLREFFGQRGLELAYQARGEDDRPVVEEREARSMSSETTFARDLADEHELKQTLRGQSEEVGRRLRESQLAGRTVRIKLRWSNFSTITRQSRLRQPTDQDGEIYQAAQALFDKAWRRGRPVRLLGVGVSGLEAPVRQLSLFDRSWEEDERLLKAVDQIRSRYGDRALQRAGSLSRRAPRKPDRP